MYRALATFVALKKCAQKIGFAIIAPPSGGGLKFLLLDEDGKPHQIGDEKYLQRSSLRAALMYLYEERCERHSEPIDYEQFD
jgi:hypothetical protein